MQQHTLLDNAIGQLDTVLKTLCSKQTHSQRPNPSHSYPTTQLTNSERRRSGGLMRVNHTGEICAQALYQGQALTAKLPDIRQEMIHAAKEEEDHLAWCQHRLNELDASPSILNPMWYALSLGIGASAGLVSDRLSLGFVAATEDQVCEHLDSHLEQLPENDQKSRSIVNQMRIDEAKHSDLALKAGGVILPKPVKFCMSQLAKTMTFLSFRI